jgi:hypothetical protein
MTATIEPAFTHRCVRGRRCADLEPTPDGGQLPAATVGPATLCETCERRAGRAIGDIPRLYTQLETIIGEHAAGGEHVSGTREPMIPPRVDVLVLQARLDVTLTTWALPVVMRLGITTWDHRRIPHMRAGVRVSRAAAILAPNLDALLRVPDTPVLAWAAGRLAMTRRRGIDGALDLLALHERGRQLVTGGSGNARLPVPCPSCEAPALVRANGSDQVDCRACGRYWPESDYRRLCLILAEDYRPEVASRRRRAA